jgi:creatinine amidohydrolase
VVTQLAELTRDELKQMAPHATALLPVAAVEQHGPHLPLITDTCLVEAVAHGAAAAAAPLPVAVAPALPYGSSDHHLVYAALSLQSDTFYRTVADLCRCLVEAGFRRIFMLNGHGGNDDLVGQVARDLVLRHRVAIASASYWNVARPALVAAGLDQHGQIPGHAGFFETSLMLAVAPELVRMNQAPASAASPPAAFLWEVAPGVRVQQHGEWARIGGYTDPAAGATPELGRRMLRIITAEVGQAIASFHRASDA